VPETPPNQDPEPPSALQEGRSIEVPDGPEAPASPYRNLLVPLVVVPALIGMVLVAVFVLFSAVTGKADSPSENLRTVLNGGKNERRQAAFSLVRQILEHQEALRAGEPSEWGIDASFLPELRNARAQMGPVAELQGDDVAIPFVLSSLMAQLGDPEGVRQLIEMTHLPDRADPDGSFRIDAVFTLGAIGRELAEPERAAAAAALIELLSSEDSGLVLASTASLQNLTGDEVRAALAGCLADSRVEIRLQAALSLVRLGDPAGIAVLREMIHPEPYQAEHDLEPRKWAPQRVSESRVKAVRALRELGEPIDAELLARWARDDPDSAIRALARELLEESPPAR
jgi:hypothetical protein